MLKLLRVENWRFHGITSCLDAGVILKLQMIWHVRLDQIEVICLNCLLIPQDFVLVFDATVYHDIIDTYLEMMYFFCLSVQIFN